MDNWNDWHNEITIERQQSMKFLAIITLTIGIFLWINALYRRKKCLKQQKQYTKQFIDRYKPPRERVFESEIEQFLKLLNE